MDLPEFERELRLNQAIAEYLEASDSGQPLDRLEFAARFPELADGLDDVFQVFDRFAGLRPPPVIPTSGQRALGQYTLLGELGRGGMGVVYKAKQVALGRLVAIKICQVQSPLEQRRFTTEAQSVAGLHHANIVEVYEVGCEDGYHFIAMRYVDGHSLATWIADNPLPPTQAADIVRSVADAVDHAHQQGILHRDIKPANIVVDREGRPYLTDFGLAKPIRIDGEATATGDVVGTPAYMSPEQARAEPLGPACDIYSLGAVLYALLTGRPPFQAHNAMATLQQVVDQEPLSPSRINPLVPRDLETICLKCLQKEPARRYGSAAEMADDLARFMRGDAILARRTGPTERTYRWCCRNPVSVVLLAALLVVTSLGLVAAIRQRDARLQATLEARARAEIEVRSIQSQALERLRDPRGDRGSETRDILRRTAAPRMLLEDSYISRCLDLQTNSIFVASLSVPQLHVDQSPELPERATQVWAAAIHPMGDQLAIGTSGSPITWSCGAKDFSSPVHPDIQNTCLSIHYTPDGKQLLVARTEGGLRAWSGDGRELVGQWSSPHRALAIGFPQGDHLLWTCCSDGGVRLFTLPDLQIQAEWAIEGLMRRLTAARFSNSCTLLATGDEVGEVKIHDLEEHCTVATTAAARVEVEALAWSPETDRVAIGLHGGTLKVVAWTGEQIVPLQRLQVQGAGVRHVEYSPDGTCLLAGYSDSMSLWDAVTGEQLITTAFTPYGFAADGRYVVGANRRCVVRCELRLPSVVRTFSGHRCGTDCLSWSADNRHLVTLDTDFECRVWSMDQSRAIDAFEVPPSDAFYAHNAHVALSTDGTRVAYASGGLDYSRVILRDVAARSNLGDWKLPGGFEQLAFVDDRFLLVREQDRQIGEKVVQTAVWELSATQPPRQLRVLRSPEPGDGSRFFSHMLLPDGRFYLWIGPREPHQERVGSRVFPNKRIEIWDVTAKASEPVFRHTLRETLSEPSAVVDPSGHYVWTIASTSEGSQIRRFDLRQGTWDDVRKTPSIVSRDGRTYVSVWDDDVVPRTSYVISDRDAAFPWLRILASSAHRTSFSPDGRYLAWGSDAGPVTVLDLTAARAEQSKFKRHLAARD